MPGMANYYISKINIATGEVTDTWINIGADPVEDLCTDGSYIYILRDGYDQYVAVYDFNGNFVRNITLNRGGHSKITVSDSNIYLPYSGEGNAIDIYSIDGSFINSFSVDGSIKAVAVKDGYIYVVTSDKIRKYNSSGVFQNEFAISGTVSDCVII